MMKLISLSLLCHIVEKIFLPAKYRKPHWRTPSTEMRINFHWSKLNQSNFILLLTSWSWPFPTKKNPSKIKDVNPEIRQKQISQFAINYSPQHEIVSDSNLRLCSRQFDSSVLWFLISKNRLLCSFYWIQMLVEPMSKKFHVIFTKSLE